MLSLLDDAASRFAPADALVRFRTFLGWVSLWLPFGHELARRASRPTELAAARLEVERFFAQPQTMSERSALLR